MKSLLTMETFPTFKILIADDDFEDLDFFKFLFERHPNFEIIGTVSSGADIINTINNGSFVPDILLTDQVMPIITGAEAVRHLIKNKMSPQMDIFIISGVDHDAVELEFCNNKKVSFLKKPRTLIDYNELPEVILKKLNAVSAHQV